MEMFEGEGFREESSISEEFLRVPGCCIYNRLVDSSRAVKWGRKTGLLIFALIVIQ